MPAQCLLRHYREFQRTFNGKRSVAPAVGSVEIVRVGEGIGARVAQIRKLRGMTQRALARRANVSYSLLTKVEAGHVPASPAFLAAAARALHVERDELTGQPYRVNGNIAHAAVSEIRQALWTYDLPLELDVAVRTRQELETSVAEASKLRRATGFTRLAAMLPGLLDELHTAVHTTTGADRERLFGMLAEAYYAVECLASGLGYEDLYLLAIERYDWAAHRSGDALLVAAAQWGRVGPIMRAAAYRPGLVLLERTREDLEPPGDDVSTLALYGSLHLRSALLAARAGDSDTTWAHLDEARDIAARTGETDSYELAFGPSNTAVHEVTAATDLGEDTRALEVEDRTRLSGTLPAERRGPYYIDLARAHLWNADHQGALRCLQQARRAAPQQTRHNVMVHETARAIAGAERRSSETLRGFASWLGIED